MSGTSVMTLNTGPAARDRLHVGALNGRMVGAEFLKVRRRRGLVAWSAILTVGVMILVFGIMAILHAQNPSRYGPAGGVENLSGAVGFLATLGSVAGILIGATMGAGDLQAGVFRDLVATGRSRVALFGARIPGGLALLWPLVIVSLIIACAASVAFAGTEARPAISLMIAGGAWVLLATTCSYLLALSVASLTGSRGSAIGQVFAWQFIVSAMLLTIASLGVARQALQMTALSRLVPAGLQDGPPDGVIGTMSIGLAFLVVAAWAATPIVAAAWRTKTRDA